MSGPPRDCVRSTDAAPNRPLAWTKFIASMSRSLLRRVARAAETFLLGPELVRDTPLRGDFRRPYDTAAAHPDLNPFMAIICRFPIQTAWFFKVSLLLGAVSGGLLGSGMAWYLFLNWDACAICARPLRAWFLVMTLLQITQSPLRFFYYKRVTSALGRTLVTLHPSSNYASAQDGSSSRRPHMGDLSVVLMRITNSSAWCITMWLSVLTYAWFLVGGVWAFSEDIGCINTTPVVHPPGLLFHSFFSLSIQTVILLIIAVSFARLLVVMTLFYSALPPLLLVNGTPADNGTRSRAYTYLDRPVQHYWNVGGGGSLEGEEDTYTGGPETTVGTYFSHHPSLLPSSDSTPPSTSSADEDVFGGLPMSEDIPHSFLLTPRGLSLTALERLPVSYFSRYVFPRTLRSPHSLDRLKGPLARSPRHVEAKKQARLLPAPILPYRQRCNNDAKDPDTGTSSPFHATGSRRLTSPTRKCDLRRRVAMPLGLRSPDGPCDSLRTKKSMVFPASSPATLLEAEISRRTPPLFLPSCSICFEDFEEGSAIRHLPCRHGFHRLCIDRWLIRKDACPLCQARCYSYDAPDRVPVFFASNQF